MYNIGWKNNVEFALFSESQGRIVIPEPINFDDGNGNIYERDENSKGFLKTKSNTLEFFGEGSRVLLNQSFSKGIAEDIVLEKLIKSEDRLDEEWTLVSSDFLDLSQLEFEEKTGGETVAKTKVSEGGLKKIIDSKFSDEFDITTLMDSNGNPIPEMKTETIVLPPREIFLRSTLFVDDGTKLSFTTSNSNNFESEAVPFIVDINSDQDNVVNVLDTRTDEVGQDYGSGRTGNMFYLRADRDRNLILNGTIKGVFEGAQSLSSGTIDLVVFDSDENGNHDLVDRITLIQSSLNPGNTFQYTFTDYKITVKKDQSLMLGVSIFSSGQNQYIFSGTKIEITENSSFQQTLSKCITYKQALDRLLLIITGKDNLVISDLITTGKLKNDVIMSGYWIRGFPSVIKEGTDEERKIQFNLSIEDMIKHMDAMCPTAWWVEKIGNKEFLRVESLEFTQQNFIGIPFANNTDNGLEFIEASNVKRKFLSDNFFSSLEFGSEKGGDGYEEVSGLQSICGKAKFSTINKKGDSVYSKLSKFRLGDVDVEIPRRKPFILFPDEDTRYDSDIMCVRAKKIGVFYNVVRWNEIYETKPSGIFRVDSAYNLDITPARLLLEHSANVNIGLYHYPNDKIVFSGSNCNSSFISKKAGEDLLIENGSINHNRLKKPKIRPYSVECDAQVSQEIEERIRGKTNGVDNWFGLVSIMTKQGIEYFRLIKSDVNKEGKHKFVEAFVL